MRISSRIFVRTVAVSVALGLVGGMPAFATSRQSANSSASAGFNEYYGTVAGVQNAKLFFRLRTGRIIVVDASRALLNKMTVLLTPGRPIVVHGKVGGDGVLHAMAIWRENAAPGFWPPDGSLAPTALGS